MQTYTFKPNDDGLSMAVMSYEGDEAHVVIPEQYCAKPISVLYDKLFAGHKEIVDIRFPIQLRIWGSLSLTDVLH